MGKLIIGAVSTTIGAIYFWAKIIKKIDKTNMIQKKLKDPKFIKKVIIYAGDAIYKLVEIFFKGKIR